MNKTIYIRREDVQTWDRAFALAPDGKLSIVIIELLRDWIAGKRSPAEVIAEQSQQIAELRARVEKLESKR